MASSRHLTPQLVRYAAGALLTFVCWIGWAALLVVAGTQIYIATHDEVTVPDFVLRGLEARLADEGLHAQFDRATFDPTGRVLVQAPKLFLEGYDDPVITARAAYVGIDPWKLLLGRIDAQDVRLLEGSVQVPAMLSPSGRAEPILRDLDVHLVPGNRVLSLRHVSGRIGKLAVSLHGEIARPSRRGAKRADLTAEIRARFGEFCRLALEAVAQLDAFDEPSLELELSPSSRGAIVAATFLAKNAVWQRPVAARATGLRATTRLLLARAATTLGRVDVSVDEASLPHDVHVRGLTAAVAARIGITAHRLDPVAVEATATEIRVPEGSITALSVVGRPHGTSQWALDAKAWALDSPVAITATADWKARDAAIDLTGNLSPHLLRALHGHTRVEITKYFNFEAAECLSAHATFADGWKFQRANAKLKLRGIDAYGVKIDDGYADLTIDPKHVDAPDAFARIGKNFARGSYEQDFATKEFRFLLAGELRPLDISAWFRDWWRHFFSRMSLPAAPVGANVDVHGFWGAAHRTTVFVFADAPKPVVLSEPLARLRTRLFIRAGFFDGLELYAVDPAGGIAQGTFSVATDVGSGQWRNITVDATSTVRLSAAAGMASDIGSSLLTPFAAVNAPSVRLRGSFDGPALEPNRHQRLDLTATTHGGFSYYRLPFEDVTFTTTLRDDVLTIDSDQGRFAGGKARLHAKLWGAEPERHLAFDASLHDASFGAAVAAVQRFEATRKGLPMPKPGKFVQEKANVRADISASAEGIFGNMLSYRGSGTASLQGAEIGSVPLFGPLSELLKFSELRFTTAQAAFKIAETRIEFANIAIRGANSAVDAHGNFLIDHRQLDFRAKVFPFHESDSVLKTVVGAVLSPISNALEVKLTGTLEKPEWAFVIGPTNLFRSLSPDTAPSKPEPAKTLPAGTVEPVEQRSPTPAPAASSPGQQLAPKTRDP